MSTQGGRWSEKSQNLVNVVCERPLIEIDKKCKLILKYYYPKKVYRIVYNCLFINNVIVLVVEFKL